MALTTTETLWNESLGMIGEYEIEDGNTTSKQYRFCNRFWESTRDEVLVSHLWNEAIVSVVIPEDTAPPLFGYDSSFSMPSGAIRILSADDSFGADQRSGNSGVYPWEVQGTKIYSDAGETPQTYATNTQYNSGEYFSATAINYATATAYVKDQFVQNGGLVYQVLANYTSDTIANDITAGNLGTGVQGSTGTYSVDTSYISDSVLTDLAAGNISASGPSQKVLFVTYITQLTDVTKYSPRLRDAMVVALAVKIITPLTNDTKGKVDLINQFERLTMPKARSVDSQQGKPKPIFNSEWIRSRVQGTYNAW